MIGFASVSPDILKAKRKHLTAISLFSGGGGLDLGFAAAGFKIGCSTDIDPFSFTTFRLNHSKKAFLSHLECITGDIKRVTSQDLLKKADLAVRQIDLVLGGPPCQAFSVFGRRKGLTDPRGSLVWEYLRIIREIQPKAFVFENVSGLKTIHGGQLYKNIIDELSIGGIYAVSAHRYQVAEFGIPQYRDRLFFIGSRDGISVPSMEPTHGNGLKPYRMVKEALRYLPLDWEKHSVPNHIGRKHSKRIKDRYEALNMGERDPKTRINKLHPERPSFTIIVGSDNGGGKGHVHPYIPREVTPRESARMQTFPDWWVFSGSGRHVIRQVGNAVPPLFAAILAEHIKKHIFRSKTHKSYEELINTLELDYLIES